MKILIIANARWVPGLSGSDIIYLNFKKYWKADVEVWEMIDIDFKPFWLCYGWRIILGCWRALICNKKYDFVYSASDFWMDSLPAFIFKLKGIKWVAGFYLYAPRCKVIYYLLQKVVYFLIKKFADVVCVTNGSMVYGFTDKKTIEVNGGVDLTLAGVSDCPKEYDAVFCGRIHPSKGIDELISIWRLVRKQLPKAKLVIIGDGDLGLDYIRNLIGKDDLGISLLGYMGDDRYDVYKKSKVVLYPAKWNHFSMSPVEAMACGCPMIMFDLPVLEHIKPKGITHVKDNELFAFAIIGFLGSDILYKKYSQDAIEWANTWSWPIRVKQVFDDIIDGLQK